MNVEVSRMGPSAEPPPTPLGTISSVQGLRDALARFQTLLVLGLGLSVLSLFGSAWTAAWNASILSAPSGYWLGPWAIQGPDVFMSVFVGVASAVLVLVGLVVAVRGFLSWRRGSRQLLASAGEIGEPHLSEARRAWEDSRSALRWVFVAVGIAILLAIALGITDAATVLAGGTALPGSVFAAVIGLGAAGGIFWAYYFGTRGLIDGVRSLVSHDAAARMDSARRGVLVGAGLGILAAVSAALWPMEVLSILAIVLILSGVRTLRSEYDGWLRIHAPPSPRPSPESTVSTVPGT